MKKQVKWLFYSVAYFTALSLNSLYFLTYIVCLIFYPFPVIIL